MYHGPQDRIYKALRNLGAPSFDVVRWAFRALDDSIEVAKGTVTTNTAAPKPANLKADEPAFESVMLVRGWVHHLNQGWPTGSKKGKKAPPAPLDPPSSEAGMSDDWTGLLSGVRRLEKRICHTLMGLAMVRSQHRCYEAYQTPLPTIEQASQPVALILPPGMPTPSSSALTTRPAVTHKVSIPTATAISAYQRQNQTSIVALSAANKDAMASRFCYGPMLAFLTCGVRGLIVSSDDRDIYSMGACFGLLSLTDSLADKPYEEDTWIWTHDYIMQLVLKTLHGEEAKPDLLELMQRLTKDYGHYWVRTQDNVPMPRGLELLGQLEGGEITAEEGTGQDDGPVEQGAGETGDMIIES